MSTDSFATIAATPFVTSPATFTVGSTPTVELPQPAPQPTGPRPNSSTGFVPWEPASWDETSLTVAEVGALAMKMLLHCGTASGRRIAEQLKLPFSLVGELLRTLKTQLFVTHKGSALVHDYEYELTVAGLERARRYNDHCTYCGAAPVSLDDYAEIGRAHV